MSPTAKRASPSRRVRLQDVAARCGASLATVSRALSGGAGVRPELRARVLAAARDCGYVAPPPLEGRVVAVLASAAAMIDYGRSQFTLNVMEGLEARAAALRLRVETRAVGDASDAAAALAALEADPAAAGALLLTLDDEPVLAAARRCALPVVLLNGDDPLMRLSSVAPCNRAAAALATDHLRALGHRRILFLTRPGRRTIERRFEGWRDRMVAPGEAPDPSLVVVAEDWAPEPAAAALAARVAQGGLDFTAVLAAGDSLAIGAARTLAALGVATPGRVSLMGMDGLPQTAFHAPPLSVIQMPMREIGAAAVDLLAEAVATPQPLARRVELGCRLLERGSTAPPP